MAQPADNMAASNDFYEWLTNYYYPSIINGNDIYIMNSNMYYYNVFYNILKPINYKLL